MKKQEQKIQDIKLKLEHWRSNKKPGRRIPDDIYLEIVKMSKHYKCVSHVAKIFRLNPSDFKKRAKEYKVAVKCHPKKVKPEFIELKLSQEPKDKIRIIAEFENSKGVKLKVFSATDAFSLFRLFMGVEQ